MAVSNLALMMLAFSSGGVESTPVDADHFKVSIVYSASAGPSEQADAQIALLQSAKKLCKGRGRAVSEGTLHLDAAEPDAKGHKKLRLSEVYSCLAEAKK